METEHAFSPIEAISRVALVTGAGSGVGRSAALALAARGYRVYLAGRRAEALAETAARASPGRTVAVPSDVSRRDDVQQLFDRIAGEAGRLDFLFNNAGIGAPGVPVDELDLDLWDQVVAVNLTGAFLCARAAFALMRRQTPMGGRILNNGSLSATTPRPFSAPYTATKHAITGLTKALALDGRAYDITVGQIDIGNAATPLTARHTAGQLQPNGGRIVEPVIDAAHIGEAVAGIADLPLEVAIPQLTIMAAKMPFVGRG